MCVCFDTTEKFVSQMSQITESMSQIQSAETLAEYISRIHNILNVILYHPKRFKYVKECDITYLLCKLAVEYNHYVFRYIPNKYKTNELLDLFCKELGCGNYHTPIFYKYVERSSRKTQIDTR